ncbi:MAG: choice-of-anchor B family protein [Thermoanaerobaculia bacterium]|nr:choice-of-anchor B family protein [Thermoanaerobaculia bacterium]
MRRIVLFCLCLLAGFHVKTQSLYNLTRLARWDDDALPVASPGNLNVQYSGCWGLAVNNREYAILGAARHVLIFDVTTPAQPALVGKFEGKSNTVWREFKSYKNRVYAVSDATQEGLMIFDFSQAPDTIRRSYWSNALFNSAHTITLDTLSGRIYLNGSNVASQGLLVLDVSNNPDQPSVLAAVSLPGGYIHDSYVRGDTVYASSGFAGYYVYDMTEPSKPKVLASLPGTGGYHHNSWLSPDGRFAYCTEEIPTGRPILVVDLQELADNNIEIRGSFFDPQLPAGENNAIPHNVYVKGHLLFDSQYEDGLLVYDISDPADPKLIAHYDTHPENTVYNRYYGCWGNYPWLPSGIIIAGDMQNGLQVLGWEKPQGGISESAGIFPNPAHDHLTIRRLNYSPVFATDCRFRLFTLMGQRIRETVIPAETIEKELPLGWLSPGVYVAELRFGNGSRVIKKIVIE